MCVIVTITVFRYFKVLFSAYCMFTKMVSKADNKHRYIVYLF